MFLEKLQFMIGTLKIKQNLKMWDNGKELGFIQKKMKVCMKLYKEKVKLQEIVPVY